MELYFIGVLLGVFVFCVIWFVAICRTRSLAKKFVSLGNLDGKTYKEIKDIAGLPNDISHHTIEGEDYIVRTWSTTGYSISLAFDKDDVAFSILNENVSGL